MGIDRLDMSWRHSAWAQGQRELGARLYGVKGFAHVTDPKLSPKRIGSVTSLLLSFSLSLFLIHFLFLFLFLSFCWVWVVCGVWCGVVCVWCVCVVWCGVMWRVVVLWRVVVHNHAQGEKTPKLFQTHRLSRVRFFNVPP